MIVVGSTETVLGQPSLTKDTCICYTDAMDIKAITCLINAPKKDSLINNYSLQIINFKEVISKQEAQHILSTKEVDRLSKELNTTKLKLKVSKKLSTIGIPAAVIIGIFTGILIK